MKKLLIFLLMLSPVVVHSQESVLQRLIESAPNANQDLIQAKMGSFVSLQKKKRQVAKNEVKFLRSMVNESHRKFLKSYKPYSQFNDLFEKGLYDCLSGTSFFSVLLEELQFRYKIIETNYHIFLLIETSQGQVLLETTDRLFGFKTDAQEIEKSMSHYKKNLLTSASSKKVNYYEYRTYLFNEVSPFQLSGLLYFNQAVVAYNNQEWAICVDRLEKAKVIYNNPRIEEFAEIISNTIVTSRLKAKDKQQLLFKLVRDLQSSLALAVR
jgi:hypothetical protein